MILKYGNYAHAVGEATIVITVSALLDERRAHYANRERWEISGFLQAESPAALTTAINAIKTAYSQPDRDLALYLSDGTTLTSHFIRSSDTLGGVRIVSGPSFPQGRGAEYSTFRSYHVVLEADRQLEPGIPDPGGALLAWEETLNFSGGGPRFVYLQTLLGLPQKQIVAAATPYQVAQQGRAVGQFSYPLPPAPIWPGAEHVDRRKIARQTPRAVDSPQALTEYEVSWHYQFESESPLAGNPTIR